MVFGMGGEVMPPNADHRRLVENIARSFAQSYKDVPVEDIIQNCYLLWYENWKWLERYVLDEDQNRGKANLVRSITNWCATYCSTETDAILGESDATRYPRKVLTELLPFVLSPEAFSTLAVVRDPNEVRSKSDPALGGDALASYADLTRAFGMVSDEHKSMIVRRFVMGQPYEEIAHDLDVDESTARKRVSRSVSAVQRKMGQVARAREPEPSQGRRAMSNAAAQSMTGRQWAGD